MRSLSDETHEWVMALFVDDRLYLLSVEMISKGSIGSASVPINKLLIRAWENGAKGFFLAHNHPGGDTTPSADDVRVTKRIALVAEACDLQLLRHVVISAHGMTDVGGW